jgi:hypothetical protein
MLSRRLPFLSCLVAALLAASILGGSPARADDSTGGVSCGPGTANPGCDVNAGTGGSNGGTDHGNGGSGGQGGDGKCRNPAGKEIPCERDGGYAGADGCYYQPSDPPASVIDAVGGQPEGEGGWYLKVCYNDDGTTTAGLGGPVWIAGAPPVVSPEVLARQARKRLNLPTVVIKLNPPGDQLVNLPVWLALDRSSWKPQSATASAGAVSVTATARPVNVTWAMGDGSSQTCDGPGTAWTRSTNPRAASPDCGHVYRHPSAGATGGSYTVTATVTWEVTWAGAGQSGTVPGLETTGQVQTRVQESQAVISR